MADKKTLTPFEKHVLENKGTEAPHTGLYTTTDAPGTYLCKRCAAPLYPSEAKFASHCGWPSFDAELPGAVAQRPDADGHRTEIVCHNCGGHLGHVFAGEGFTPKNIRHCVNSVSLDFVPKADLKVERAILASGCFWGTEYFLARLPGVVKTTVGYTGGSLAQPSYEQVCSKTTGHFEAVEVEFDPHRVSYERLVQVFFETHDFSQSDGQGPDIGPQYRSAIFYLTPDQERIAQQVMAQLRKLGHEKIATMLLPAAHFWPAEVYHQHYYERKGDSPYCHAYRRIF